MGFSLLELLLVLSLIAVLGSLGVGSMRPGSAALAAVQGELRASLEQAILLARAQGKDVRVVLGGPGPGDIRPLVLPLGVHWGLPPGMPPPPRIPGAAQARETGWAHPCSIVTPRHTAEANVWFLTDGRDGVCLRLNDEARITLLRRRHGASRWRKV